MERFISMDAVSNVRDLSHLAELLKANDQYVLVPHVQPDPDAFGAACGLALLLKRLGKSVVVYTDEVVLENYRFLGEYFPISHDLPDPTGKKLIFVDGGAQKRLPAPVREWKTWMNIDHHLENGQFAEWIYVDTTAAASSLLVARIADAMGVPFDEEMASCLFTGLLFDTRNGFVTHRCTPEVYHTVGRLVEAGARPDHLNRLLNEQMTMGDVQLYGMALSGLKQTLEGKIVFTSLTWAMFTETGGTDQAMEMLTLNLPQIGGGEIYALFKENEDGEIKVSLRSRGRIAVNLIAKRFNGGGHKLAAGINMAGPLEAAIKSVVSACELAVREEFVCG